MSGFSKLGLGTVQWGLPYGLSNQNGITSPAVVSAILAEARHYGIQVLDTASLYGKSEAVLGANSLEGFKIVTKTPKFNAKCISEDEVDYINKTFLQSLRLLSCKKIYGLLVHHADDLLLPQGEKFVRALIQLKESNLVEKIGVSVYEPKQIDAIMSEFIPDLIQLPLSVLDQRMLESGHLELLKSKGVEIHARSIFLQGLLLMPLSEIPSFFDPVLPLLNRWHASVNSQGLTPAQAAIAFVKNILTIDTVVVGFNDLSQFRSCISDFAVHVNFDAAELACNNPVFVNPSLWHL